MDTLLKERFDPETGKKVLRHFAVLIFVVFLAIGGYGYWQDKANALTWIIGAVSTLLLGVAFPIVLKPLYVAWMALAFVLGWVVSRILLTALFFLVLTPIGLIAKLVKKRFLHIGFEAAQKSYWINISKIPFDKSRYKQQF